MNDIDNNTVLVAGDYCPYYRIKQLIEKDQTDSIFADIHETIRKHDISIVNFECSVESPYDTRITKHGESLRCSEKAVALLKEVGFNTVTLANNHFYDYGDAGVVKTIDCLRNYHIDYVGGGNNIFEASKTLYKKVKGKTIAIINCCENEFSIATNNHGGSNPLNPIKQYYEICEARKNADAIIVIVHGGHEHYQYPSPRMKEVYRFFVDTGADVVVNGHQHCFSGYEVYRGKPIFYGLGNFCFDWQMDGLNGWHKGYMVGLSIDNTSQISFVLYPYIQCYKTPSVNLMKDEALQDFNKIIQDINKTIDSDQELMATFNSMTEMESHYYSVDCEPYNNRLFRALFTRRWLPSMVSMKKLLFVYNHIACESHHEIFVNVLKRRLKI